MTSEQIYNALYSDSPNLPPDPDPTSSRIPEVRNGLKPMPTCWANLKVRNMPYAGSEADFLLINTYTGVVAEYEIKVSPSDLIRECRIADFAGMECPPKLRATEVPKFRKHYNLVMQREYPPNYYSFVVPKELVETCILLAPQYAGIYSAEVAEKTGWIFIKEQRTPRLLKSVKADCMFYATCAEHLCAQLSYLHRAAAQIKNQVADSHRVYLMDIAKAIYEAERLLAEVGRSDDGTKRFLIERAVSGLTQRDKDHVARYYYSGEFLNKSEL